LDSFFISKYQLTQKEWKAVMGNNPSVFKGENNPVEEVSWYDAIKFCNKKSEKEGLEKCYSGSGENTKCDFTKNGYRLPTEAEWEYAARGGVKTQNSASQRYSGSNNIKEVAWYEKNADSDEWEKPHADKDGTQPVGQQKPNELGIYDMSGNVYEWCNDWYGNDYCSKSSKKNPQASRYRGLSILRGGSWNFDDNSCRVAYRYWPNRDVGHYDYGFRFARTP